MDKENTLITNRNVFICIESQLSFLDKDLLAEVDFIKKNFCGNILNNFENANSLINQNILVYVCGNIKENLKMVVGNSELVNVVKELSYNYEDLLDNYKFINIGEIPLNINNVGIYFRNFFNENKNYFELIKNEHKFQNLKESNKPTNAFRSGIYLSNVFDNTDSLSFNLLRCSTNLDGPTENFKNTDLEIINKVNEIVKYYFEQETELNHVLAQIYKNSLGNENSKSEKKAKIKEHSDKTKDMPRNGLMAFCTFYENYYVNNFTDMEIKNLKKDGYNFCYKKTSALTKMRFRLKKDVIDDNLVKQFDILLYPNSVFIMSLEMNRLYTHEIIPSTLPIFNIPTRMGYVIRCSKTKAVHKNNQTFILDDNKEIKLQEPDNIGVSKLKETYLKENVTSEFIHYDKFYFSLNEGDYQKPNL